MWELTRQQLINQNEGVGLGAVQAPYPYAPEIEASMIPRPRVRRDSGGAFDPDMDKRGLAQSMVNLDAFRLAPRQPGMYMPNYRMRGPFDPDEIARRFDPTLDRSPTSEDLVLEEALRRNNIPIPPRPVRRRT